MNKQEWRPCEDPDCPDGWGPEHFPAGNASHRHEYPVREETGQPFLGPAWARDTQCCAKPAGCTNMSSQCRMTGHPWKKWYREEYSPPDPVLGTECPACGDTYHDLPRHLELNFKGCAAGPGPPTVLL